MRGRTGHAQPKSGNNAVEYKMLFILYCNNCFHSTLVATDHVVLSFLFSLIPLPLNHAAPIDIICDPLSPTAFTMNMLPTAYLSSLKQYVVDASSSLTQTKPIQNVKDTVSSTVVSTKDYFYPKPEEHEMRSVVRLDGAFLAEQDIVEYATPGQPSPRSPNTAASPHSVIPSNSANTFC